MMVTNNKKARMKKHHHWCWNTTTTTTATTTTTTIPLRVVVKGSLILLFVCAMISQYYLMVRQPPPSEEETTRTIKMDDPTNNNNNVLNLIPRKDLDFLDQFSDSWLIHKEMLLELNTTDMPFVEQACFQVMMMKQSKMFVDWTEFMVEHLSKWWNELRILQDADSTMFDETISILKQFIQRQSQQVQLNNNKGRSPLHPTIGMVAFQEYKSVHKGRGHLLSTYSLAATLTSLLKVGFGRIIVVGYGPSQDTIVHVRAAFELLLSFLHHQSNNHNNNNTTATTFEKVLQPSNPSTNGYHTGYTIGVTRDDEL
eukprot:scaffold1050_cov51-Cylindrotheca_fusiformis.AAC.1